jgi:hypothetical protein
MANYYKFRLGFLDIPLSKRRGRPSVKGGIRYVETPELEAQRDVLIPKTLGRKVEELLFPQLVRC